MAWIYTQMTIPMTEVLMAMSATFVITWLIGFERQNIGKAAGISSHVLVAMSACAIAVLQREMYVAAELNSLGPAEGQRIIAQVIAGIGFIGAGVIMKSDRSIKGLTTAATLWSSAIIGLIFGSGYFMLGFTLGSFIIAFMFIRDIKRHINPFKKQPETHVGKKKDSDDDLSDYD